MLKECLFHPYRYYILTTWHHTLQDHLVLKHGDCFGVFNRHGDIAPQGSGEEGLYYRGCRFLSRLEFTLCDTRLFLLNSAVRGDNLLLTVDMTNPDIFLEKELFIPRGTLHIYRGKFLAENHHYEQIKIQNFACHGVSLPFSILFDSDFADIFEVRGVRREKRGKRLDERIDKDHVALRYQGLDGIQRETWLFFYPKPFEVGPQWAAFHIHLKPKETAIIFLTVKCQNGNEEGSQRSSYKRAFLKTRKALKALKEESCIITTSNEQFNAWLERSYSDISMMLTETPHGLYPYAGIPWYSTIFGRDGIITAIECLWINPSIAKGVLTYLAATQAQEEDPEVDAQPGKIIHELREGEMAAIGEIPFGRYYGSVDATPLFVILAGLYHERTNDTAFLQKIWPNIRLALEWIDRYGDVDDDGFVEYQPSPNGLVNKGWKDSHDSIFYADGSLATPPIALVEVQGYVYEAKLKGAYLAEVMGERDFAHKLREQAVELQRRFAKAFWDDALQTYVLALDGAKRPCKVRSSNAGHALFSGIALRHHAHRMVATLMGKAMFSGWGVRTLSSLEIPYNPASYHNGSIWPHDNAIIAIGLSRYGFEKEALKIMKGLFEASTFFPLHRLPELFCGLTRRPNEGPIQYPVACNPQSWASGAVFLLLQACLGLSLREKRLYLHRPALPQFLNEIHVKNLRVGDSPVDLLLRRYHEDVVVNVLRKEDAEILITK